MIKRPTIRVNRNIAGSYCVIEFPRSPWGNEVYIDARADRRSPHYTFVEVVMNGFVKFRETIHNIEAPERLIALTKYTLSGGTFMYPDAMHQTRPRGPASRSGIR